MYDAAVVESYSVEEVVRLLRIVDIGQYMHGNAVKRVLECVIAATESLQDRYEVKSISYRSLLLHPVPMLETCGVSHDIRPDIGIF